VGYASLCFTLDLYLFDSILQYYQIYVGGVSSVDMSIFVSNF